ncbi:ABC transporter permease [Luteococcus sp. Sow4_B9]|uniref:ABC transporter permease n=1 Tax=Luteococcus sp. Sow4_B9 TaxID=3438792 RepID=UPI003F94E7D8
MTRPRDLWPFWAPATLLLGLLAIPLAGLAWVALTGDLWTTLREPSVRQAIRLSVVTTLVSMLAIIVTGTPLAYLLACLPGRWARAINLLVDLPIVLPPMVAGIALLEVFGRNGLLGQPLELLGITIPFTTTAVVLSQVFVAGPFFVRAARVGFTAIAREIREAARVDGANEPQLFRHIMVPAAGPALVSGLVLAWARALGEFGATIFFAGNREGVTQTMPLAIFIGFESNVDIAVALAFVLMATSILVLAALAWVDRAVEDS